MDKPIKTGETGRDEKGRYMDGHKGEGGRPAGKLSITDKQQAYFREHPDEWEAYCKAIRDNPAMMGKMWDKFDPSGIDRLADRIMILPSEIMETNDINASPEVNSERESTVSSN